MPSHFNAKFLLTMSAWVQFLVCVVATSPALLAIPQHTSLHGTVMGMEYRCEFSQPLTIAEKDSVHQSVISELLRIEQVFSLYQPFSELSRWNQSRSDDWIEVSPDFYAVFQKAKQFHVATHGAFDPTIRPLKRVWRFDSLSTDWRPPTDHDIADALRRIGVSRIESRTNPPALRKQNPELELDLNALVEGWCLERIALLLQEKSIQNFLVSLGGEYLARGVDASQSPWSVLIEDPLLSRTKKHTNCFRVALWNQSVSTSGTYRSGHDFEGRWYSHLLDPRTGRPVDSLWVSATVVSESAMEADGWATALLLTDSATAQSSIDSQKLRSLVFNANPSDSEPLISRYGESTFHRVLLSPNREPMSQPVRVEVWMLWGFVGFLVMWRVCLLAKEVTMKARRR